MTPDTTSILQTIHDAAQGLLFPSESDFPIDTVSYGDEEPTAAVLLERRGLAADCPVEETQLASMFEGLTEVAEDSSDRERNSAERFCALKDVLEKNLENIRVYRLGEVDIEVFALGRHASGTWLGVRTNVVET